MPQISKLFFFFFNFKQSFNSKNKNQKFKKESKSKSNISSSRKFKYLEEYMDVNQSTIKPNGQSQIMSTLIGEISKVQLQASTS